MARILADQTETADPPDMGVSQGGTTGSIRSFEA
jgi:hypothetical protein